ncbi:MAG: hypothetical protein MJ110_06280, partial [Lachnospiraceae bacterium]|nr:hypothetical protein [Lachnospiraceae bacterium]
MLLTGILAGGAVAYGTYKYNAVQSETQKALEDMRLEMYKKGELSAEDIRRLERYESTYGSSFNNILLDKVNPNSLIRSNRKSHKIFQKTRKKIEKLTEKKSPYVENETQLRVNENGIDDFVEVDAVKPVDTYRVGKYVVSYDYLDETPNYVLSYTNSIFGHMHKGLKKEMEYLRAENAGTVSELAEKEKQGKEIKKIKKPVQKDTWEYKLLVESQEDIEKSRKVKDKILEGSGFWSKVGKYATKRFGNFSESGRALKRHNTLKKRVKRNIALYQAESLKAYRELQASLADEKELLDARSEDVVSKFDDIFFTDTKVIDNYSNKEKKGKADERGNLIESKLAFDPMQIDLEIADKKSNVNILDHDQMALMGNYQNYANIYKQLVKSTFDMRQGKGENYATIIALIKRYGQLTNGERFEDKLPMCHGFFRTGTMRRAMSAGIIDGTDDVEKKLTPDVKRTLDFARIMLMQCVTQLMFQQVNNNPNLFVNLEAFGKLSANYQTAKLAATALMNRVDFQETVEKSAKKESENDRMRLMVGTEYLKEKIREDLGAQDAERYDKYVDNFLSYRTVNDPKYRDLVESLKNVGANEHIEDCIIKTKEKIKDDSGKEIERVKYDFDRQKFESTKDSVLQVKDYYTTQLRPLLNTFGDKRGLIRMYVEQSCKGKTLGLKKLEDKLVNTIEDKLGEDMLLGNFWEPMLKSYRKFVAVKKDNIGKTEIDELEIRELRDALERQLAKTVPETILDETIAERCNTFKDKIMKTLRNHGGNCVFDIENLWKTDEKIAQILSDTSEGSQEKFDEYLNTITATLNSNIAAINQRMQVVANSFVFNSRRNKVFDYIGANIFSGGTKLIESLTDYAINRIMTEAMTDKATETLEKNVAAALDQSVLENRWKISSMQALNAKLLEKGEDPASYTVEKLVRLFNEWNDEFARRSNKIVVKYSGIYMAPEQIEKEMAFFDEHAWLKDADFEAAVDAHIKNLKAVGILKTEKSGHDVTIDEFMNAMRDREKAYEVQKPVQVEELFLEEISSNPAYKSIFNDLMSGEDLFELMLASVKEGDEIATFVPSLKKNEIGKLSIGQYSQVKKYIESRLLPLAKHLDSVPKELLTNAVRNACIKRALAGELELISPESLVAEELQREENREELNKKRSCIIFLSEGKEMGAVEADKSRMNGTKAKKDELAKRQKNIETAANFWSTMWKEDPEMARELTKTLQNLNASMQERYNQRQTAHLLYREEQYTEKQFHEDYKDELKRFVKKFTKAGENVFTNSEICVEWYLKLPRLDADSAKKLEEAEKAPNTSHFGQNLLDDAVAPFLKKVREFVKAHNMKFADLDACSAELALMGNADVMLGVGQKYEDTLYKSEEEYAKDLHNITDQLMRSTYVEDFIENPKQLPKYDEIKKLRGPLLSSRNDETKLKRDTLFKNVHDLALALLDAADAYEPNIIETNRIRNLKYDKELENHRAFFGKLREKADAFKARLDTMDQLGDGAEEILTKSYNEFFAEIEKAAKKLNGQYHAFSVANESLRKAAEKNKGKVEISQMTINKKTKQLDVVKKSFKYKDIKFSLGKEEFVLGVNSIIEDHKEMIDGAEAIKSIFRQIQEDQEKNLHQFGAKDAYRAYNMNYAQLTALQEIEKANKSGNKQLDEYRKAAKNYEDNCNRIRSIDQKVGNKDKLAIFLPVLFQDDRFMELMTESGEKNDQAIDKYLTEFKQKVANFLEAIVNSNGEYAFDMTTVVPQFIEHHKEELLHGSSVFASAKDYKNELKFIMNAWKERKSGGKSAQDVVDSKASKELPITKDDKKKIFKAIMQEGTVSYSHLTDSKHTAEILNEYKRKWDRNLAMIKELPSYKKLLKMRLNGSTKGETVADLLCETYADKLITMSQMDLLNCFSIFAEHMIEVNDTRSISVGSKENPEWDYVKEHKIKEDIDNRLEAGRNALAPGNAAIRKAADSYYNGVSILSNAKTHKDAQKLITAKEMEKNREKVKMKLTAIKAAKKEKVNISQEDLDILTELYSTGNVWDSFPLLWKSNIEEAFEALRNLRAAVMKEVNQDRAAKKDKTGLTDELRDHDINRFILYMAAHGRLHYNGGADGFIIEKSKELWHWVKTLLKIGKQDVKQEYVESELSYSQMYSAYAQIQGDLDSFTAEGLNLRKSQYVIDQCNSERIALQMAMFTMNETEYNELKDERSSLLVTSVSIADAVSTALKSNDYLNQENTKEIDKLVDVLTRGFIDYYGKEIKELVPVRKGADGKDIILTQKEIDAERKRMVTDIQEKLSGQDVMYYISAFSAAEDTISEEERTKKGPVTKRTVVSVNELDAAINALGEKRAKKFAQMTDEEKNALALIVSQPFRFLATDRVGAINMVMDHDKVTDSYFHKMNYVEENRTNAAAIDIVNLLSGKALEQAIDYTGAYERLAGRVGTKGGKVIFDQALELMELCKERIDFYKTREWDTIADPEQSIKVAGLVGKNMADTPEARELKNSNNLDAMKIALSKMLSSSTRAKLESFKPMGILVTLLQNRSILDESTISGKEGIPVNALMREQVTKDLCTNITKRAEYQDNASKQMYIKNAVMSLLSFQVRDDAKLESGLLKVQDILDSSLNRTTAIDEKLLSRAIDMANAIDLAIQNTKTNGHIMDLEDFNEQYNENEVLSGKKKSLAYSSDLDGILFNVNSLLRAHSDSTEFSIFKDKAGEKALAFRKSLADKWA